MLIVQHAARGVPPLPEWSSATVFTTQIAPTVIKADACCPAVQRAHCGISPLPHQPWRHRQHHCLHHTDCSHHHAAPGPGPHPAAGTGLSPAAVVQFMVLNCMLHMGVLGAVHGSWLLDSWGTACLLLPLKEQVEINPRCLCDSISRLCEQTSFPCGCTHVKQWQHTGLVRRQLPSAQLF